MGIQHGRPTVIGPPCKQSAERQTRSKSLSGTAWQLFVIVLFILLPELPQAAAHAVLLEHFLGENEIFTTSPGEVLLRFDEPVTPVLVRVFGHFAPDVRVNTCLKTQGAATVSNFLILQFSSDAKIIKNKLKPRGRGVNIDFEDAANASLHGWPAPSGK